MNSAPPPPPPPAFHSETYQLLESMELAPLLHSLTSSQPPSTPLLAPLCTLDVRNLKDPVLPVEVDAAEQTFMPYFLSFMVISAAQQMLIYSHTSRNMSVFGGHRGLTPVSGMRTRMDILNISYNNKSDVVTQLLFNLDVTLTLQQLYPLLSEYDLLGHRSLASTC